MVVIDFGKQTTVFRLNLSLHHARNDFDFRFLFSINSIDCEKDTRVECLL